MSARQAVHVAVSWSLKVCVQRDAEGPGSVQRVTTHNVSHSGMPRTFVHCQYALVTASQVPITASLQVQVTLR
jgi:hypothetical protein